MKERFSVPCASVLMLLKTVDGKTKVLLQRRQNTGFMDGLWDLSCSGHVEHGENMSQAAVREAKEELGVDISPDKIKFFVLVHKREDERDLTYCNPYFVCSEFAGEPRICEAHKCSEIKWFDLDNLPDDLIDDRKQALKAYLDDVHYIE
ncbi:MAG: NUDIX domain-containing protein, partial [Clostridia bacterium]|nr:NUDIX domain-containing protein [Clostridia bacterium]